MYDIKLFTCLIFYLLLLLRMLCCRGNVNIQGKIRSRTQDVPGRSSDCVISVGAMKRSVRKDAQNPNNAKVELINEAYRFVHDRLPVGLSLIHI